MKETILKIFWLQGLHRSLLRCQIDDQNIFLELGDSQRAGCPNCGRWSRHRHARGPVRRVFHGAGYGHRVYLQLRTSRYACRICGKPFSERLGLIAPRQRRTQNAEQEILASLRGRSLKSVAVRDGLSYGAYQRILTRRVDPAQVPWPETGPISLGIDGHSFRGPQPVNTITDVRARQTLTILPDNRQKSLTAFLQNIPEPVKNRIQGACIDMESSSPAGPAAGLDRHRPLPRHPGCQPPLGRESSDRTEGLSTSHPKDPVPDGPGEALPLPAPKAGRVSQALPQLEGVFTG